MIPRQAMSKSIDHIAIKVDNVELAVQSLLGVGFVLVHHHTFPAIGIDLAELELGGIRFELMGSMHANSPIARDEPGLHHIALAVENLDDAYSVAHQDPGLEVLRPPAPGRDGRRVFFARVNSCATRLEYVDSKDRS